MEDITKVFGILAGLFSIAAYVPYIRSILKGETKPNRASWSIWTVVSLIIAVSYYAAGARETMWVIIAYVFGSSIISLLSIKHGEGGWTPFDRKCVYIAGASLVLWGIFSSALIALFMNTLVDFSASMPTIRKAYHDPKGENRTAWVLFFLGSVLNVLAIREWTFVVAFYPVAMIIIIGTITGLLFRPQIKSI